MGACSVILMIMASGIPVRQGEGLAAIAHNGAFTMMFSIEQLDHDSQVIVLLILDKVLRESLAMQVMGTVAVTGVVSSKEALARFSTPAVVTI